MEQTARGIWAALTTPFRADGSIDLSTLRAHAEEVIRRGCVGVSAFGTTGEGPSIGIGERSAALQALVSGGLRPEQIMPAVTASALPDAIEQGKLAHQAGCRTLLVAPPFYYKDLAPASVADWFAAFIAGLGTDAPGVVLYHIPQLTGVAIGPEVITSLVERCGNRILGVKDSSGDWANTERLLRQFPELAILIGDERLLARGVPLGAAGSISGVANLRPDLLNEVLATGRADPRVIGLVESILRHPVVPAVKALVAHEMGESGWLMTRPPLHPLADSDAASLCSEYDALFARKVA